MILSRKLNDHILHPDICFVCRTHTPYILFIKGDECKLFENFLFIKWWPTTEKWKPLSLSQLPAISHLSHLSISWHFLLSALIWLNLWHIVRRFSQWQDYKMPDTSLLVPLQLSLNIFLFDTNCTWSVDGKPDPINSNNFCESWEVNSSFTVWQKKKKKI